MFKISDAVINFVKKNMKTWRVKLTAVGRRFAETKIQGGIFQGDAPWYNLTTYSENAQRDTNLVDHRKKINHLMYMDDIKLFAKNEKELESLIHAVRIYSHDLGMEFGREKLQCL